MIEVLDDTELQELPPDPDNMVDQLAVHAYNPDVLDTVNKLREARQEPVFDDPEDLLESGRYSIRELLRVWDDLVRGLEDEDRDTVRAWKLRTFAIEYTDEQGDGWTLSSIPLIDPLNLFFGAYTSKSHYHVASASWELTPRKLVLQLEGPDGQLLAAAPVYPFQHKKIQVSIEDIAWPSDAPPGTFPAWRVCLGAWVVEGARRLRIPVDRFYDPHGQPVTIPWQVKESFS